MLTPSQQEQHYDTIAQTYATARQETLCNRIYYDYLSQSLLNLIPERIQQQKAISIVDPMCGSGELLLDTLKFLGDRVNSFYGIDISAQMLAYAPSDIQSDQRGSLIKGDVRQMPIESDIADLVIIRGGLHHVFQDLKITISEIYRVLKPGGTFVFFEPSDDNILIELARKTLYEKHDIFVAGEEKGLKAKQLTRLFEETGFQDIKILPFGFAAYTLIGNTDVFPLCRNLTCKPIIHGLITLDHMWEKLPLLNRLNLAFIGSVQKPFH